jgi:hypothetical protein
MNLDNQHYQQTPHQITQQWPLIDAIESWTMSFWEVTWYFSFERQFNF